MTQKPPKKDSFFVVKGLVFRTGSPYEEVVPQTGPKGLRVPPGLDLGSILARKMGEIRPTFGQNVDTLFQSKTQTKNGGRSALHFLLSGVCFGRQSTGFI